MSEHFDAAVAVGTGLTGRQRAWAFIADVAAAFTAAPLGPEDGVPEDELRRAEHALGFPLPDDDLYDACELPAELMPTLRENFQRIKLPDYPMWASADDSPIRWYSAPDVILRLDGIQNWAWLHARARTPAGLEAIRHLLPGRWVR